MDKDLYMMVGELTSKVDVALELLKQVADRDEKMNDRVSSLEKWRTYTTAFGAGVVFLVVLLWKVLTGNHG